MKLNFARFNCSFAPSIIIKTSESMILVNFISINASIKYSLTYSIFSCALSFIEMSPILFSINSISISTSNLLKLAYFINSCFVSVLTFSISILISVILVWRLFMICLIKAIDSSVILPSIVNLISTSLPNCSIRVMCLKISISISTSSSISFEILLFLILGMFSNAVFNTELCSSAAIAIASKFSFLAINSVSAILSLAISRLVLICDSAPPNWDNNKSISSIIVSIT